MVSKNDELHARTRYISVLIDALLAAHPEWKVERRHVTDAIQPFQYVIFSVGEQRSSIAIDVRSDTLESIRRRFHFLEADFLWSLDKNNGIALTKLPDYMMIDLMGPEPAPGPSPDYRAGLKAGVQIVLVAELLILTIVSWAYITIQAYPG